MNEGGRTRPRHETTLSGRRVTSSRSRSHRADGSSDYDGGGEGGGGGGGGGGEGVMRGRPDARRRQVGGGSEHGRRARGVRKGGERWRHSNEEGAGEEVRQVLRYLLVSS